ncbi:hypothetical protein PMZ80_002889 [Knufia obscura]|uniref:Rhamnogalacturonase A/B/Epimerase-like pectate lyase domain-containing protein n=1 Tax=Knufia obscura TaxID=1635080 RepID=A0ABR0RZ47_9EURO|nr:hypothetical protein PMZ80_002889 [Knufia obscura]
MLIQLLLFLSSFALGAPRPYVNSEDTTPALDKRQSSSYWMETITRQGQAAYNPDKSYKIFRNVKDYGATGDGNTDDSAAINRAIREGDNLGDRCGGDACDSSTITPAIVYFPAGTYKISNPLIMYYYTQMIGDANSMPRIQGSADFNFTGNLALLDADPYIPNGNGANWFTNQNNFYRQIRNLVIDMTLMPEVGPFGQEVNGIHWQVAQACSMQNVVFDMKAPTPTSKQRGIMMENGSGMFMSDVVFNGGNVGAYLGSQQFATRNFTFNNCNTAIEVHWNWLWTFKSLNIQNCKTGVNISTTNSVNETVGSAIIMDSKIQNTGVGVVTSWGANTQPEAGSTFFIHNVDFSNTNIAVQDVRSGNTVLPGNAKIAAWGQGNAYIPSGASQPAKRAPQGVDIGSSQIVAEPSCSGTVSTTTVTVSPLPATISSVSGRPSPSSNSTQPRPNSSSVTIAATQCTSSAVIPTQSRVSQQNMNQAPMPSSLLTPDGSVFERSKPQYVGVPQENFVSIKSLGAKGDGTTDDSDIIQQAMNQIATDKILYFDHGAYVITKTIEVPPNIRIVGEIWPMIMISGPFFQDQNNPQPGFRIGKQGDSGNVEISDMMFETKGPVPGAIMMQWNVQETTQGSCGMWDTHFRVGGSAGTDLQKPQCPITNKEFRSECAASFMMMHVSQQASAYFENTWFWVADHDLDLARVSPRPAANETQITLFNGRGVFIESQGPVWLWGTSSEHSVLYNYQIANAKNVFMASIQTETAYYQSAPNALESGFTPNAVYSDPDFANCTDDKCKKTWGLRILDSTDIYMFGGGLYSFFDDYKQDCLDTESCQTSMIDLQCSSNVFLYGFVTRATTNQLDVNGQPAVLEADNTNLFGSTVLLYQQQ